MHILIQITIQLDNVMGIKRPAFMHQQITITKAETHEEGVRGVGGLNVGTGVLMLI